MCDKRDAGAKIKNQMKEKKSEPPHNSRFYALIPTDPKERCQNSFIKQTVAC